ncbi:MAG: substrate-binding domain-containing protein [Campylobacteraceae bacterium]|jgi:phosphate transport system substrate-binding protein|nr:substrate-binding domain-containing protein [Campylobacteraceae bacterium]
MLKKIFTNTYTALFLYIPILLHAAGLLVVVAIEGGGDLSEIIRGTLSLLISILFFAILGYFWGKKFINKVSFTAYFAIFALMIYNLFCMNLAFILSGWSYEDGIFWAIAFFSNIELIIVNALFIFGGSPMYIFMLQIAAYGAFGAGAAFALWKKEMLRLNETLKKLLFITLILALGGAAQWAYKNSKFLPYSVNKLEKVGETSRFFAPRDNDLIDLRGEPTLVFEDNAPKIDGATALCPIFYSAHKALYAKIEKKQDYIWCSTTPHAYEYLIDDSKTELIFAASPSDEQIQAAKEKGIELILTPIGKEAFVFLTNKQNPVNSLSVQNIKDIYSGKIKNWRELGGENEKILAFQRNENSGSQTAMQKYVMKDTPFIAPLQEEFYGGMGGLIEGVADYRNAKNAIGYSFRYYATVMNKSENIKLLSIDGIEPSIENIKNGSYPFTAEFYIVSTQNTSHEGQKLIKWFLSEQGQILIKDIGYVPLKEF